MLDTRRIHSLLADLRKRSYELETVYKPLSEKKLLGDSVYYSGAERNLQVAIQAVIDISNHIVAGLSLGIPRIKNIEQFLQKQENKSK